MSVSLHGVEGSRSSSNCPVLAQDVQADEPSAAYSPTEQSSHLLQLLAHALAPAVVATCVPHTRMSQLRPELALSTLTPDAAIDIVKWMPCAVNLLPEFRSAAVEEFRRGNKDQRLVGIRHGPGASEIRGLALYRYALPRSFACPLLAF